MKMWPRVSDAWGAVLARAHGRDEPMSAPALELDRRPEELRRGPRSSAASTSHIAARRAPRHHRPERRRQVDAVQPHQRPLRADLRHHPAEGRGRSRGLRPTRSTAAGCRAASRSPTSSRACSVYENIRCARAVVAGLQIFVLARHRQRSPTCASADRGNAARDRPRRRAATCRRASSPMPSSARSRSASPSRAAPTSSCSTSRPPA